MSSYQVFLKLSARRTATKVVLAFDAHDAILFAEALVPRSTARGVVELTPFMSA